MRVFVKCLFFVLLIGCRPKHESSTSIEINNDNLRSEDRILLSAVADSIYYVSLSTPDSIFLNSKLKYQVYGDNLFVLDEIMNQVYQFTIKGNYVGKMISNGSNANEVTAVTSFCVDDSCLYILDSELKKIESINYKKGYLKKEFSIDEQPMEIKRLSNKIFLFCSLKGKQYKIDHHLSLYSIDGKREKVYKIEEKFNQNRLAGYSLQMFGKKIRYWLEGLNQIFEVDENLQPEIVNSIQSKDISAPEAIFSVSGGQRSYNDLTFVDQYLESSNTIFLSLIDKKHFKAFCISKKDWLCKNAVFDYSYFDNAFVNDIDGGIPFWPSLMLDNGQLSTYMQAYKFRSLWENPKLISKQPFMDKRTTESKEMVSKLTDDGNPVLIFVKPKNNDK